ncbi:MAG TPA: apolipoprotein N-acyltransferase, partial [Verrucomicrobiae bacterium]|nr:apolipoprotein N-acyltransferase [Verrucomicrobiae bacterium]
CFTGFWVWFSWRISPARLSELKWKAGIDLFFERSTWLQRTRWALECAVLWVALEMFMGRFLSGFPWDFLGVSQYRMIPIIQVAEYTGVYGVSFLLIWFSVSLAMAGAALLKGSNQRRTWAKEIALPLLLTTILAVQGWNKLRAAERPGDTVQVALIQPSIPQTLIWDEGENANRFQQLLHLSEQALTNQPDILIWPEASVPNMLRHDQETADAVIDLAKRYHAWIILGSDDAERRPGTTSMRDIDYFNSAFAVSPEGVLSGRYQKRRLVIFGEYVPFVKWLPFLKMLSPAGESGFTPGARPVPFHLGELGVIASVLICFEDTFPHIAREYVREDTDFLVNLTNNGWFGESAAQWQHAATAVFRAVENRIALVRCANNGLTCWVDARGVLHETYFPDSTDVYKAGYKLANVPILAKGQKRDLTFYTRFGDVFGWTCCGVTALLMAAEWQGARKRRSKAGPHNDCQNS